MQAGNHKIGVVVDPDNDIVETNENNNIQAIPGGKMSSTWGALDVGVDVVAVYSVPVIIIGATLSLIGVAGFVIYGSRIEELEVEMHKEIALRDCETEQTELVARHFTREFETFASSTGELKL